MVRIRLFPFVISKWLLPELSIPAAGQKDRGLWGREWKALGATISGMCHRCRLREPGWSEFGYFLCISKWLLPELSIPAADQKDRRLWGREWEIDREAYKDNVITAHARTLRFADHAFSFPEPTILLAYDRNRELWGQPF